MPRGPDPAGRRLPAALDQQPSVGPSFLGVGAPPERLSRARRAGDPPGSATTAKFSGSHKLQQRYGDGQVQRSHPGTPARRAGGSPSQSSACEGPAVLPGREISSAARVAPAPRRIALPRSRFPPAGADVSRPATCLAEILKAEWPPPRSVSWRRLAGCCCSCGCCSAASAPPPAPLSDSLSRPPFPLCLPN